MTLISSPYRKLQGGRYLGKLNDRFSFHMLVLTI